MSESSFGSYSVLNGMFTSNPSVQSSGNSKEEEAEGVGKTEEMADPGNIKLSTTVQRSSELTETEVAITGPVLYPLCIHCSFKSHTCTGLQNA